MFIKKIISPILSVLLIVSCSGLKKNSKEQTEVIVIRYINIRALYSYLLNKDEKAQGLKQKIESLNEEIEQDKLKILSSEGNSQKLYKNINKKREKLQNFADDEEKYKGYLLNKINIAVKKVAESSGCDFVLNMGDEILYGKKKYDITEDVLRELELLEKRADPVSR